MQHWQLNPSETSSSFKRAVNRKEKCIFRICLGGERIFLGGGGQRMGRGDNFFFGTAVSQGALSQNIMQWGFSSLLLQKNEK